MKSGDVVGHYWMDGMWEVVSGPWASGGGPSYDARRAGGPYVVARRWGWKGANEVVLRVEHIYVERSAEELVAEALMGGGGA